MPTQEHFLIHYDGSRDSLWKTAEIVACQMEVDLSEVNLDSYKQNIQEFGSSFGQRFFTEVDGTREEKLSSGLYFEKEERNLADPVGLVATLAHEFSHIKLLGERRLKQNDEMLTDLSTVVFGLGNSIASFQEYRSFDAWGHHSIGYMKQQEWGYALALYAHFREEEHPQCLNYLTSNIKSDFMKSQAFIFANFEKIFWV